MWRRLILGGIATVWLVEVVSAVQSQATFAQSQKVDFGRDVQPILRQNCYGCHGPTQQMNGFRLDRRRDAMRGGTIPVIGPGNSDGSRLYQRLIGSAFGQQMPPTGPLRPEQTATIKAWLDQGADWPDEFSGETVPQPPDPSATRLMNALRGGNRPRTLSAADRNAANLKGAGGSTPLMYAVLYGDTPTLRLPA